MKIIYNGAEFCHNGSCPVVSYDKKKDVITISDPSKPQNGQFTMTVEEYNTMLENAKKAI